MPKFSAAFQFYPEAWLSSTNVSLMSPAEEGAYIRLLCHAWNAADCSIPADDQQLAILSRLGEAWFNGSGARVKAPFTERNGRLYNERLLKEREKQKEWRKKSSEGGKTSGRARKQKGCESKGGSQMVATKDEPTGNSLSLVSVSVSDNTPPTPSREPDVCVAPPPPEALPPSNANPPETPPPCPEPPELCEPVATLVEAEAAADEFEQTYPAKGRVLGPDRTKWRWKYQARIRRYGVAEHRRILARIRDVWLPGDRWARGIVKRIDRFVDAEEWDLPDDPAVQRKAAGSMRMLQEEYLRAMGDL